MTKPKSIHPVNIDAIAAGVGAFLDWPDQPQRPTIPDNAHAVLWEDDYWRGVDIAREVVAQAFGWSEWKEPPARTWIEIEDAIKEDLKSLPKHYKRARLFRLYSNRAVLATVNNIERASIFKVAQRMKFSGWKAEMEDADLDVVDVIEEALRGLIETGDPEHRTEAPRSCDDEVAADAWAEA